MVFPSLFLVYVFKVASAHAQQFRNVPSTFQEDLTADSASFLRTEGDYLTRQMVQSRDYELWPVTVFSKGTGEAAASNYDLRYDDKIENIMIKGYDHVEGGSFQYYDDVPTSPDIVELSLEDALRKTNTDAFIIMKDGVIVYEKYFGNFKPNNRHVIYSMTKSYIGVIVAELMMKRLIDENELVSNYVGELKKSEGLNNVTVRQLLDMTAAYQYEEDNPEAEACKVDPLNLLFSEIRKTIQLDPSKVGVDLPIPFGCEQLAEFYSTKPNQAAAEFMHYYTNGSYVRYPGAQNSRDFLVSLKKKESTLPNGEVFEYKTSNTNALALLVDTVLKENDGKDNLPLSSVEYFEDRFWSKFGAHSDGFITVDHTRFPFWGGYGQITLRDGVLFGNMMLNDGHSIDGTQVVPKAIIDDILKGGTPENIKQFSEAKGQFTTFMNSLVTKDKGPGDPYTLVAEDYLKAIGEPNGVQKSFAYRNQWWVIPDHAIFQNGIFGQNIWVDYDAQIVIGKFSSNPSINDHTLLDLPMFLEISTYFQEKFEFNARTSKSAKKKNKSAKKKKVSKTEK